MYSLSTANLVWLIPGLPLIGFFLHAFFGRRLSKQAVGTIATAVVFGSFLLSLLVLFDLLRAPAEERRALASLIPGAANVPWISIGSFRVDYGALIDPLSLLMCLIVTGVGGLIHLYATGYMAEDRDYSRFFTYFNLFIFFMLMLVLGENMLLMFIGWEGVGLCSYLLISFWYEDMENSKAGNKAFIVNRIGDVGFALGIMAIFSVFGTLTFYKPDNNGFLQMAARQMMANGEALPTAVATVIGLLLFIGACGKSAQIPLYVWLPDAMAGPTPVSALIHAATMVTAGVVMVTRVSPLLVHSPTAMTVISVIGLCTAFLAATIALSQNDIKRVLAYSTVSQLGYMFLGCGVGAFTAGMFHVTTHAFFKALLFLGAGAVIHALHHEQDMRKMGGLKNRIPITHATMVFGWLAICGIAPFAGFWSKDEILHAATGAGSAGMIYYVVGLLTAVLTAFYMSRLMWKTFWTKPRFEEAAPAAHSHSSHDAHGHDEAHSDTGHGHAGVHEPPRSMLITLVILAFLSLVGGWIGTPWNNQFERFLEPSVARAEAHHAALDLNLGLVLGILAGALGIVAAWRLYDRRRETGDLLTPEQKASPTLIGRLYRGSAHLWYIDSTFYRVFVVGGGQLGTIIWRWIDQGIIDGIVNAVGILTAYFSHLFRQVQTGYIRAYALSMLIGVVAMVAFLLWGTANR